MSVPQSELIRFLQNENMVVYNNRALANQCRTYLRFTNLFLQLLHLLSFSGIIA